MNVCHVVPTDDLIEHDSDACVCGPDARPLFVGMQTESAVVTRHVGWTVVHHSLDGRKLQKDLT